LDAFLEGRGGWFWGWWRWQQRWQEKGIDYDKDDDKDLNGNDAVDNDNLIFWHNNNQPVVGIIPGMEGGDFDDNDNSKNNGRRRGLIMTRMTTKTLTAMTPWKTTTSFFDTTTNLWPDAFLSWRGGWFWWRWRRQWWRHQQWQERGVDSVEDDDEDPNGDDAVDKDDLIFWHNNQHVVGCIPGRDWGVISMTMTMAGEGGWLWWGPGWQEHGGGGGHPNNNQLILHAALHPTTRAKQAVHQDDNRWEGGQELGQRWGQWGREVVRERQWLQRQQQQQRYDGKHATPAPAKDGGSGRHG